MQDLPWLHCSLVMSVFLDLYGIFDFFFSGLWLFPTAGLSSLFDEFGNLTILFSLMYTEL